MDTKHKHLGLINLKTIKTVVLHLLFWVGVWFFFRYFFGYNSDQRTNITFLSSALLPVTALTTYIISYYLIPTYLLKKKYSYFALYSFYTVVFTITATTLIIVASFVTISGMNIANMPPMSKNFVFVLIIVFLVVGIVSIVSLLNHNFKSLSRNKELQNKILRTRLQIKEQELQYLKKQIHPHFLFNTLNTIYGFALKQSKDTPEIILKLSNLLDYILYQVNKPQVSLREEVLHVKEYVELEKIRFQDSLKVDFNFDHIAEEIQIAPMLLIPFVENAFKHGSIKNGFLQVKIGVSFTEGALQFRVSNTSVSHEPQTESQGIGLENIRKRLDLHYPEQFTLNINHQNEWFTAKLSILNLKAPNHA